MSMVTIFGGFTGFSWIQLKLFLSEAADCLITDLGVPEVGVASSGEQAAGSQAAAAVVQQILPPGPLLLGSQQGGGVRRRAGGI